MVKKSKKSKSKRVPLRKKYKIIRKVKEHHKKKAKEAKKLGTRRKRVEKDPGIPSDWPFKEQELKALEARRARAIEELEQKKAAKKERAQKRKLGLLEDDDVTKLAENASVKEMEFTKRNSSDNFSGTSKSHDNSERTFYKELVKVIETSDVILEVLDVRDPLGTRCVDMEKMVLKSGPDKHLVLVLNKIDLVPREAVEKWLKYLREELPAVAFRCSTQQQRSNLGWKKSASKAAKPSEILQTSDCLGAETLIRLLKNYSRSHELKKSITVGVVGLPNVGKSSLINSLKRSHVVSVGATPGLTRTMQEIHLDKNVRLLDCPGVVMLRSGETDVSIALRNCKRIEKLNDPIGPVKEILKLCPAEKLMALYKLPSFESVDEFLQKLATIRGKLKKGGAVDVEAAARIVLRDWNEGKIPYYTLPPIRNEGEILESAIVSELGKEFNVDEIYKEESSFIGSLASVEDLRHVEVPPSSPLNLDEQMTEENIQPQEEKEIQDEEQPLACDDENTVEAKSMTSSRQNDKLYTAEGILDPRIRRAEKKRRKARKASMMDEDYDFKIDYVKKGVSTDDKENVDEDENNGDDGKDDQMDGEVRMSGIELDA